MGCPSGIVLERELQPKLNGACSMCVERMKEAVACVAIGTRASTSGIGSLRTRVAADRVAWGIALGRVKDPKLSVIDDVKAFSAKFNVAFAWQGEILE